VRTGFETAGHGRIDKACTPDAADWPGLAAKRQRCAGFDDRAEALAPHGFDREIDGVAGELDLPQGPTPSWSTARTAS
jgi:hypothetical protein